MIFPCFFSSYKPPFFSSPRLDPTLTDGQLRRLWQLFVQLAEFFSPLRWQHDMIWVNYNDLTTTSLEIMVSKGNHPQMALIQVSESL